MEKWGLRDASCRWAQERLLCLGHFMLLFVRGSFSIVGSPARVYLALLGVDFC